jgi:hypothetical protein
MMSKADDANKAAAVAAPAPAAAAHAKKASAHSPLERSLRSFAAQR